MSTRAGMSKEQGPEGPALSGSLKEGQTSSIFETG